MRYINGIKAILVIGLLLVSGIISGCGGQSNESGGVNIYYVNSSYTSLVPEPYQSRTEPDEYELIDILQTPIETEGLVAPLADITVLSMEKSDGKLIIEFGREYTTHTGIREVLTRASVVKTLTQLEDIQEIEMNVGGAPLMDSNGEATGTMRSSDFIDYFGNEQDDLYSEEFTLYYATAEGDGLIREKHIGYYESNMSREQAVIKYMQETPETEGARVAISPRINIINMTTADGTCYLDMDMSFYDAEGTIPYNVSLMAIVNSLCELSGVHNVMVSIIEPAESGMSELSESISGIYEPNYDLVVN